MTIGDESKSRQGEPTLLTVAHRAANNPATLRSALDAGIDLIEADVRYFKGVPEVRHFKSLGTHLLWEPGEVVPRRNIEVPTLADLLESVGDQKNRLLLDLKGFRPGLGPAVAGVLAELAPDIPMAIATPHWWMFKSFADLPHARPILTAGSWPMVERLREVLRKGRPAWPNQRLVMGCAVHRTLLTEAIVTEMRAHVPHVLTWPVDTPEHLAEARSLDVTGIISQDISLLASVSSAH